MSLEAAVKRSSIQNEEKRLSVSDYDELVEELKERDKLAKFLSQHSSIKMRNDWEAAETDKVVRKNADWKYFVECIQSFYEFTMNTEESTVYKVNLVPLNNNSSDIAAIGEDFKVQV